MNKLKARKVQRWSVDVEHGDGKTISRVLLTESQIRKVRGLRDGDKYFLAVPGAFSNWVMRIPGGLLISPCMKSRREIDELNKLLFEG
jgi:hypothetical protein